MPNKINCLPYIFFILYHQEAKCVIVEREPRDNIWIYHCKFVEGTRQTDYLQSLSSTVTGDS